MTKGALLSVKQMPSRGAMTIAEFEVWASLSNSTVRNLINNNELKVRKVGRRTVITYPDALEWLNNLPEIKNT